MFLDLSGDTTVKSSIVFIGFTAPSNIWQSTGQEVASALRALGLPVGPVLTMETMSRAAARNALKVIREADKVKG